MVAAGMLGAAGLAGCAPTAPAPRPTVFDNPATPSDEIPAGAPLDITESRLAATWQGDDVYLGLRDASGVICMVVVPDRGARASACVDTPPLELDVAGDRRFLYDLRQPDSDDGWQPIGPDVYARRA